MDDPISIACLMRRGPWLLRYTGWHSASKARIISRAHIIAGSITGTAILRALKAQDPCAGMQKYWNIQKTENHGRAIECSVQSQRVVRTGAFCQPGSQAQP